MNSELKNLLIIDIETVSVSSSFETLPENLRHHWERKALQLRNDDEKSATDLYFEKAGIYAEFGKIIVIAVGIFHEVEGEAALRVTSFQDHDEAKLLNAFKVFLETKFNQQHLKLCGHNGKEFDFPFLCRRMIVNEVPIPQALNLSGKKPWEVQHIDTMDLWKFGDKKNYTSLDLLTSLFNIDSSKSNIDGSQVNKVYYSENKGLTQIVNYCQGDVIATAQVYLKLKGLPAVKKDNITRVDQ
jgi:uncharacterized protein YprB with RNaseH-like and TPR domain